MDSRAKCSLHEGLKTFHENNAINLLVWGHWLDFKNIDGPASQKWQDLNLFSIFLIYALFAKEA